MSARNGRAPGAGTMASGAARPALLDLGLSPAVTKLLEVTLVGCWWVALYPVCHAADGDATWNRQLAVALLPMFWWLTLAGRGLPAWWRRRDHLRQILGARLWPVVATATAPAYPVILNGSYRMSSVAVVAVYALGLLFLLAVTPLGLRLRGAAAESGPTSGSTLGRQALALGGLCCALSLSGLEAGSLGQGFWSGWLLELLREALRWAGVIGLSLFLVARGERFPALSFGLYRRYRRWSGGHVLLLGCGLSVLLSGLFAYFVLGHVPHIPDEVAMIFQAKNFAAGRLYATAPPIPDFFDQEFVVVDQDRWYGKYQFGPSLWYLPGVLLNCVWLVSPVFSALAIVVLYFLAREVLGPRWSKGAVLLAIVSPWWVMTFGSMMAHAGCLLVLSAFGLFFVRAARSPRRWGQALLAGIMLGLGVNFRPYTALLICAAAIVAALAAGWWRNIRPKNAAAFLLPVAAFIGLMLAYNRALTGGALVTPFSKWSEYDHLGFGPDKGLYDDKELGFTPGDGLENVRHQLEMLGRSAMGWPAATLLLTVLPLLSRRYRRRCGLLALAPAALIAGYFFYHYGWPVYYGVRYWSESLAAYLMLTLVGLEVVRRWVRAGLLWAGVRAAAARSRAFMVCMVALLLTGNACGFTPKTVRDYASGVWWGSCSTTQRLYHRECPRPALVFIDTAHYRRAALSIDWYGAGFHLLSPSLEDQVLFVRDLGHEQNRRLMALYPHRRAFRLRRYGPDSAELQPYDLR